MLSKKRGFTLIELLVVVLIVGVLAAVAVPQYRKAVYKSDFAKAKLLVIALAKAEEVYYLANGGYTSVFNELDIDMPGGKLSTSTDERYEYDWGFCRLNTARIKSAQVYCGTKDDMVYKYRLAHATIKPNIRFCNFYGSHDLTLPQNQICKAETNDPNPTLNTGDEGDYTSFIYQ